MYTFTPRLALLHRVRTRHWSFTCSTVHTVFEPINGRPLIAMVDRVHHLLPLYLLLLRSTAMALKPILFLVLVSFPFFIAAEFFSPDNTPPISQGLSWDFYEELCPEIEPIVRDELQKAFKRDIGLAAALLRIHFHDCFVQGCDGSVLLDGSASGPGEQQAPPNLTLRPAAFTLINKIRERVHKECGRVVSCSDIVALTARDSVALSGGPDYPVPLGRRDGLQFASQAATLDALPPSSSDVTGLLTVLNKLGLDVNDLVALSGGHTIGIGHCPSFDDRLYPAQDPILEKTFAKKLKATCPTKDFNATTVLDIRSPDKFDNKYYVDLMNRQGLFTSDQTLHTDRRTKPIVTSFAIDQELFFEKFAFSMVKMGQLSVLTGNHGEIRANCSARNPTRADGSLWSVVGGESDSDAAAAF